MRILAAMILVFSSTSVAWAKEIACPESISVESQDLSKRVKGWRYFSDKDAKHTLDTVEIFKGKKKLTRHEPGKGTEAYAQWMLTDNGKEEYYLVCGYKRTAVMLKQKLDSKLITCKVSFMQQKGKGGPQQLHKFTCE